MRRARLHIAALCAASLMLAAPAQAQKSNDLGARRHKGLLLQAGMGVAYSRTDHDWGLSLPSVTIGTYARRNLVLGAHFTGATHLHGLIGSHPYAFMLGFYGPMVQYWWDDRVYFGTSVGLLYYSQRNTLAKSSWGDTITGFGLNLKGAMTAYNWDGGRINVFVEVLPAFFGDAFQFSTVVGLEWQYP